MGSIASSVPSSSGEIIESVNPSNKTEEKPERSFMDEIIEDEFEPLSPTEYEIEESVEMENIVVVGYKGCGKTSYIKKLVGSGNCTEFKPIGLCYSYESEDESFKIWEVDGDSVDDVIPKYFTEVCGVIVMFDSHDLKSFEKAKSLVMTISDFIASKTSEKTEETEFEKRLSLVVNIKKVKRNIPVLLLSNRIRIDVEEHKEEEKEEDSPVDGKVREFMKLMGSLKSGNVNLEYFEISCSKNLNITESFDSLLSKIM